MCACLKVFFGLNYILPNNMYFLLCSNPLKILQNRKQWKKQETMPCMTLATVAEAAPAAGATLGKGYGQPLDPWERVWTVQMIVCFLFLGPWEGEWTVFGPLRKGMNSPNDCLLSVSGPLGKGDLILDPWERVWTVQLIVCFLFLMCFPLGMG